MLSRPWTHKESLFLTQSHEQCGLPWCASQLRRTVEDCVARLKDLGVAEGPEWIDIGTAGRLASCSGSTIRALAVAGSIGARKTRIGRWEVRREDVLAYAAEHQRVTEESGLEVARGYKRKHKKSAMPKNASERPVDEKESVSAGKPMPKQGNASEGILEAKKSMSPETPAGYITVEEYAEAAGVSRKIAMRRCWDGKISCRKQGKKWFVSETEAVIAKPREAKPEPDRYVGSRSLGKMSRLDILKALASGAIVGGLSRG